jgi:hypothetical protein
MMRRTACVVLTFRLKPEAIQRWTVIDGPPSEATAASPTSLRQGYGGPPELQRRRKGARAKRVSVGVGPHAP